MTLNDLAGAIHKSRATVSKYEHGEISIDIETLFDLTKALNVVPEQLLGQPERASPEHAEETPAFFQGLSRFYGYYYDGAGRKIIRSVFEIYPRDEGRTVPLVLYLNCLDLSDHPRCEKTFRGELEHFDSLSQIQAVGQENPMERVRLQVLASFLQAPTRWGLFSMVTSRPASSMATKMLLSARPLKENRILSDLLRISKEDIRQMKHDNMFSVV